MTGVLGSGSNREMIAAATVSSDLRHVTTVDQKSATVTRRTDAAPRQRHEPTPPAGPLARAGGGTVTGEPVTGEPVRVLLADDHSVFRHGLRALLDPVADIAVVG